MAEEYFAENRSTSGGEGMECFSLHQGNHKLSICGQILPGKRDLLQARRGPAGFITIIDYIFLCGVNIVLFSGKCVQLKQGRVKKQNSRPY